MLEQINTSGEAIDALGGDAAVARLLGLEDVRTVWNWRARGLPRWTFIELSKALEAAGKPADASLWRMNSPARTAAE